MVRVTFHDSFKRSFSKIKDSVVKQKVIKQLEKIKDNPEVGKPMKYSRKGMRELYIKPYRLSYMFDLEKEMVFIIDLYHKKFQ
ncbi:MAG: mRNA-degrading endonuclease RelE of RelBE toxin-antitoxin system [Patescibacteria group bacterium]|jgi:mRNA-degrading endonuclease RelE of RelBE toxin-antitoxin system